MSSRAVRKALKRLEAQKELEMSIPKGESHDEEEVEEEDAEDLASTPVNPFAMLNEIEEPDEEQQTTSSPEDPPSIPINKVGPQQPTPTKKSKNKKKKRKPKDDSPAPITPSDRPTTPATPSDFDDIDRAIQEISQKYPSSLPPHSAGGTSPSTTRKHALLSVSTKHLDADVELRKLFGKVVDAEAREARRQPIHGLSPRVVNRIKAMQKERKRTIMKPKDEWQLFSAYNKQMLSMDIVGKEDGVTRFKFVHSRRYQDVQMQFFITALGGDANVLMGLLREHPFHVDTCVQVSEILKHQGSLSEAADLIERALFALDCGIHPMFNLSLGTTRLPFQYFENRSFYLAIWHHMDSLGRRGCWRTALEFNKLLFAIEPEENPYAALLAIDFPAMKAREYEYLVDLRDSHEWIDETEYLLNIYYTAALAEYMLEKDAKKDHTASSESLSQAIQRFPWLIAQLFYSLKITFPPEFPTTVPPSSLQALYTDLYIHRSKDLWIVPEISSWLQSVAKQTAAKVVPAKQSHTLATIPLNVARHVFVMNVPALMSHIPREYTSRTQLASDPLPPENSISPYDAPMRSLPGLARDGPALHRWIQGIVRRGGNEEEPEEEEEEEDEVEVDDDDEEHMIGGVEEPNETLVAQLTNAIRNTFSWFGGGTHNLDHEDQHEDDGGR